jgi:hypothetical protein
MIASTLFTRVVPADRARGFALLIGWDAKLVQSTAMYISSLSGLTSRAQLDAAIKRAIGTHAYSEVRDVTAEGVKAKLCLLFNEPKPGTEPAAE